MHSCVTHESVYSIFLVVYSFPSMTNRTAATPLDPSLFGVLTHAYTVKSRLRSVGILNVPIRKGAVYAGLDDACRSLFSAMRARMPRLAP